MVACCCCCSLFIVEWRTNPSSKRALTGWVYAYACVRVCVCACARMDRRVPLLPLCGSVCWLLRVFCGFVRKESYPPSAFPLLISLFRQMDHNSRFSPCCSCSCPFFFVVVVAVATPLPPSASYQYSYDLFLLFIVLLLVSPFSFSLSLCFFLSLLSSVLFSASELNSAVRFVCFSFSKCCLR